MEGPRDTAEGHCERLEWAFLLEPMNQHWNWFRRLHEDLDRRDEKGE